MNPKTRNVYRTKLIGEVGDLFQDDSIIDYFLMYLPNRYINEVVLPRTNAKAKEYNEDYEDFTYSDFIKVLGLFYMMEVVRLPTRRMYWSKEKDGLLPAFEFGKIMSLNRFEEFLSYWQLSDDEDVNKQVLSFIDAVNEQLKETVQPGESICVDESMIKAYHRDLAGKMKIIRKPRPIGNELKTVCDSKSKIVLHMEMHESKENMEEKEFRKEY